MRPLQIYRGDADRAEVGVADLLGADSEPKKNPPLLPLSAIRVSAVNLFVAFTFAFTFAFASTAHADSVTTIKLATVAPEGTAWARELKAFSRDLETLTGGAVHVKWYMGGIAGDELQVLERIRRGQLDGQAGAQFCDRLAPSLRVTRVLGLFHTHAEVLHVLAQLQPMLEREFQQHGFVDLGVGGGFGETMFFSREPMRSLADLKRTRIWIWDLDEVPKLQLAAMGIVPVPTRPEEAAHAYDDKRLDGFLTIPAGALAFQWSSQARYFTTLHAGFLPGCLALSTAAYDALPLEQQTALRQASAKFIARFEDVGVEQDAKLVSTLFERQGLERVPLSPSFEKEFYAAAESARDQLGTKLVSRELLQMANGWLEQLRAVSRK